MVDKMMKYSFILLSEESENFLEQLQELGVVDITRSGKPVDEATSAKYGKILKIRRAIDALEALDYSKDEDSEAIKSAASEIVINGCKEVNTTSALAELESLQAEKLTTEKLLKNTSPWGEFDRNTISDLESKGVKIRFYTVPSKEFNPAWAEICPLEIISQEDKTTYFVTLASTGEEYSFPLPEQAQPQMSATEIKAKLDEIKAAELQLKAKLLCLKEKHLAHMYEGLGRKTAELDRMLAKSEGERAVDGMLCTFEGFAPASDQAVLDEAFNKMGVLYIKEEAQEEDNPPIKLRNNGFNKLFECLTGMYGMPVYGEWDPTPVLSVFFLLFFAMCMGDAGYGVILIIYGILQHKKIINISMFDGLGKLISILGVATTIVGFFLGTAFGVNMAELSWIPQQLKSLMLVGDINVGGTAYALQMVLALCIGVFHISLAMIIKALLYTKRFGIKENISTWGWVILIIGGIITAVLTMLGCLPEIATKAVIIAIALISVLCIFIFNKPGRNPLINIGAGLWDTYNMATGILGDVLSYIRLYALGLAGGMLGGAFNNLGSMILGDNPTWHWLPFVLILLFGHVLNLLMSCLGAFVHPLRLTFVEYFKNSGYEGKGLKYNPLKK